jgi:quercetin dioxygenase-like cupin family protein
MEAQVFELRKGESIHVQAGIVHRIKNVSASDLEFLVISQPKAHGDRTDV